MGTPWIWLIFAIVFGIVSGYIYTYTDTRKRKPGITPEARRRRVRISATIYAIVGFIGICICAAAVKLV